MRQFELHRTYRRKDIAAFVLQLDSGIHISLYGGDQAHIGAVGVVDPSGACTVTEFPCHREGSICKKWAESLSAEGFRPAVMEAGIHYDSLDRAGINAVLALADELLEEMLRKLK